MLLVFNVVYHGIIAAHVARGLLHRSRAWACEWLKRYCRGCINGLKNRHKSGRPHELSEEVSFQIKKELKESNIGWTTKQVEDIIVRKSGGIKYHYTHIYHILCKWDFKQKKVPRKVHANTFASKDDKKAFKKRSSRYLWINKKKKKNALL